VEGESNFFNFYFFSFFQKYMLIFFLQIYHLAAGSSGERHGPTHLPPDHPAESGGNNLS